MERCICEVYDVREMVLVGIHFDWGCYYHLNHKDLNFLGVYGCMFICYVQLTVSSIRLFNNSE